jgi:hypothetical protein
MDETKKARLRAQVNRLFKSNPEGSTIEFVVNDEVRGTYDIPRNHYVEIDSKRPIDWLNGCLCFEVDLKGLKNAKVGLRMHR